MTSLIDKLPNIIKEGKKQLTEIKKQSLKLQLDELVQNSSKKSKDEINKLIYGDNLQVIQALLAGENSLKGKVDLIYIDPPFASNSNYKSKITVGDETLNQTAYSDCWKEGAESYLAMMCPRLMLMRELLSEQGSIYVHIDWHAGHYIKILMDEIFGRENFVNDIIWHYEGPQSPSSFKFANKHDYILRYSKDINKTIKGELYYNEEEEFSEKKYKKDEQGRYYYTIPRGDYTDKSIEKLDKEGKVFWTKKGLARIKKFVEVSGDGKKLLKKKKIPDVWNIPSLGLTAGSREVVNYGTQKPEALLERIIKASSREGSIVADFFAGSGTLVVVAGKLNRKWIVSDIGRPAIAVMEKRFLNQGVDGFGCYSLNKNTLPLTPSPQGRGKEGSGYSLLPHTLGGRVGVGVTPLGNKLEITLKNYHLTSDEIPLNKKNKEKLQKIIDKNPLELIEYWMVDTDYNEEVFRPSYYELRDKKRNLKKSIQIPVPAGKAGNICIKTVDVFGFENFTVILPAPCGRVNFPQS